MLPKIIKIKERYGDEVFREGIANLLFHGQKNYRQMDVEKEIRISELLSTPSGREVDEIWFQAHRCAKELSAVPIFDIMLYLQENCIVTDIRRFTTVQMPNPRNKGASLYYTIITPKGVPAQVPEGHKVRGRPYDGAYVEHYWIPKPNTKFQM